MSDSATRQRNPRGEGGRLREQLMQAAAEVLDEVGDAALLSVRAIARRASVSPTALYLHFPDRDALVAATVDAGFAAFNAALLTAADGESEPIRRLEAMSLEYLAFSERQPALYAVLFSARRPAAPESPTPATVDRAEVFAALVVLLRDYDPTLDAEPARALAIALWSSLHGFAMLRVARPRQGWPSADAYVRRVLTALLERFPDRA